MTEDELNKEILTARLENETLSAEMLKCEIQQIKNNLDVPFYRSSEFVRPLVAGLSLAMILAAYIQYIFLPTQNTFTNKLEAAKFTIQQNSARYGAQLAKLELIKEQIEQDAERSKKQLQEADRKLNEAIDQNLFRQCHVLQYR